MGDQFQLNSLDKDSITSMIGMMQPGGFDIWALIAGGVFGMIGFFAFLNGKKYGAWKRIVIGIALMIYPYFTPGALWTCSVGILLCIGLYFIRD